jgi:hypothetical protein
LIVTNPTNSNQIEGLQLRRRRRKFWSRSQRATIHAKTGGRCYSCGLAMELTDDWWVEHIVPFSLGGTETMENLLPSCKLCNHLRLHHKAERFHLLLTVGDAMLREIDKDTVLGREVVAHLEKREAKRRFGRKYADFSLRSHPKAAQPDL